MKKGEEWWKEDVDTFFSEHEGDIRSAAQEQGVDEGLLRATFTEEMSHRIPVAESWAAEKAGFGRTVGPG